MLCKLDEKTMPDIEKRYRAYKLLRELDSLTSTTMNQVAYGRLGGPAWQAACEAHRAAFNAWIEFADSLAAEAKDRDCASKSQ
ncbi:MULTISPECIES: hypothetical protein [unclassified Pseudomonas]|uniref:hypothetical protein n=1 Tax=unclassified Pseudomonas TaxID=196821 RepID=UPI0021BA44AE|nr:MULTISPECIES: hypothetical protein [unclassified Pseudomonas]MCT8166872.1 hypothetical protein [Pseudomonas sp. HD6422]MCT8185758.1 hypothetical protein [Pseudomonas sp. HD6421]